MCALTFQRLLRAALGTCTVLVIGCDGVPAAAQASDARVQAVQAHSASKAAVVEQGDGRCFGRADVLAWLDVANTEPATSPYRDEPRWAGPGGPLAFVDLAYLSHPSDPPEAGSAEDPIASGLSSLVLLRNSDACQEPVQDAGDRLVRLFYQLSLEQRHSLPECTSDIPAVCKMLAESYAQPAYEHYPEGLLFAILPFVPDLPETQFISRMMREAQQQGRWVPSSSSYCPKLLAAAYDPKDPDRDCAALRPYASQKLEFVLFDAFNVYRPPTTPEREREAPSCADLERLARWFETNRVQQSPVNFGPQSLLRIEMDLHHCNAPPSREGK